MIWIIDEPTLETLGFIAGILLLCVLAWLLGWFVALFRDFLTWRKQ